MMRLRHSYIIFLVSFMSATPFGYVIKGGASAKASARSDSFGGPSDHPLSIPHGSGFSGSFSKSSSSSFSSASSSSSSSSFSFGDASSSAIGGGLSGHDSTGCSTSGCQHNVPLYGTQPSEAGPSIDPVTNKQGCTFGHCQHGADITGTPVSSLASKVNSGSNTASGFGSSKGPDYRCKGSQCSSIITKPILTTRDETLVPYVSSNNCSSGLCEGTAEKETKTLSELSIYDIPAKIQGPKVTHHSVGNVLEGKRISEFNPDCSFGDCRLSLNNSNSGHSLAIENKRPIFSLQPPKGTTCDKNCQQIEKAKPSSYDVPIASSVGTLSTKSPESLIFLYQHHFTDGQLKPIIPTSATSSNTHEKLPVYTGGFGGPPGILKPNEFNIPSSIETKYNHNPTVFVKPSKENIPNYTGGFGGPPGILRPNEFETKLFVDGKSETIAHTEHSDITKLVAFGKPTNENLPTYITGSTGSTSVVNPNEYNTGYFPISTSSGAFSHVRGYPSISKPSANVQPTNQKLPTHAGGFGVSSGTAFLKPGEFNAVKPSVTANSEAVSNEGHSDVSKPLVFGKPTNENLLTYTTDSTGSTGEVKPIKLNTGYSPVNTSPGAFSLGGEYSSISKPSTIVKPTDQNLPTYTGGFSGPSGFLKPYEFNATKPSVNVNSEAAAQAGHTDLYKPDSIGKPTNQHFPTYSTGSTAPTGIAKPNKFNTDYSPISTSSGTFSHAGGYPSISKPRANVQPTNQKLPTYTGGFGAPSGTDFLKSGEFNAVKPSVTANSEAVSNVGHSDVSKPLVFGKPTNENLPTYTTGSTKPTGEIKPIQSNTAYSPVNTSPGVFSHGGEYPSISKPSTNVKPIDQNLPTYTGGFGGPSGFLKPNEFNATIPSINVNSEAAAQAGHTDLYKPDSIGKPTNQHFPTYSTGSTAPTGIAKPNKFNTDYSPISTSSGTFSHAGGYPSISKPSANVQPTNQKLPTYTGGFGAPSGTDFLKPGEFNAVKPSVTANSEAVSNAGHSDVSKPLVFGKPTNENLPTYTTGSTKPTGEIKPIQSNTAYSPVNTSPGVFSHGGEYPSISKPSTNVKPIDQNLPTYTGGFGGPSGFLKPNEFNATIPSINVNSEAAAQAGHTDLYKPDSIGKPTNQHFPTYSTGSTAPTGIAKPNKFNTDYSPISTSSGTFSHAGGYPSISKPSANVQPTNQKLPTYTGGFGAPSGTDFLTPGEFNAVKPSVTANSEAVSNAGHSDVSKPLVFGKPTNENLPTYTTGSTKPTGEIKPIQSNTAYSPVNTSPGVFSHGGEYPSISKPSTNVKPIDQNLPTYTGGFGGPSGFLKPNEFNATIPSKKVNSEAAAQAGHTDLYKPDSIGKPTNQHFPTYSTGSTAPTGIAKPNKFNTDYSPISTSSGTFSHAGGYPSISKPSANVQPTNQKLPTYTGGFGAPSGTDFLKPGEFNAVKPSVTANSEAVSNAGHSDVSKPLVFGKPTNENLPTYTTGSTKPTGEIKPIQSNTAYSPVNTSPGVFSHGGEYPSISKPSANVKPTDQNLPTYTGGFGGPSGFLKPNEFDATKPSVNVNSEAAAQAGHAGLYKPDTISKPTNQHFPTYSTGSTAPTGISKPNDFNTDYSPISTSSGTFFHAGGYPSISKPSANVQPTNQKLPTHAGGFGAPSGTGFLKPGEFNAVKPSVTANSEAVSNAGHSDVSKPLVFGKPTNENLPTYTTGSTKPTGEIKPIQSNTAYSPVNTSPGVFSHGGEYPSISKPSANVKPTDQNLPTYTGGFGGPSGFLKPNEFDATKPSVNVNSEAAAQAGHAGLYKPDTISKPTNQHFPTYSTGSTAPTGISKPNDFNTDYSPISTSSGTFFHAGGYPSISKPSANVQPTNQKLPTYTGGFGAPSGTDFLKPGEFNAVKPSVTANSEAVSNAAHSDVSKPLVFGKPTNENLPTYTTGSTKPTGEIKPIQSNTAYSPVNTSPGVFSHGGEYPSISKPSANVKPTDQNLPTYTGGFGGPSEFLKPNEFNATKPSVNVNSEAAAQAGHTDLYKPDTIGKPTNQHFPTYSTGSTAPTGTAKPNKFNTDYSPISTSSGTLSHAGGYPSISKPSEFNAVKPSVTANSEAVSNAGHSDVSKPLVFGKPNNENLPAYITGSSRPTGEIKPIQSNTAYSPVNTSPGVFSHGGEYPSIYNPSADVKPTDQKQPTNIGGFGEPSGYLKPHEFDATKPFVDVNSEAVAQAGHANLYKPSTIGKPTNQHFPTYNTGSTGPTGVVKPNYFNSGYSSINTSPGAFSHAGGYPSISKPSANVKPTDQKLPIYTGGFGGPSGFLKPNEFDATKPSVDINSGTVAQAGSLDTSKPVVFGKPTNQNHPTLTIDSTGPIGVVKPNEFNTVYSPISSSSGVFFHTGNPSILKPSSDEKPADPKHPDHTGGFSVLQETGFAPNKFDATKPSASVNNEAVAHGGHLDVSKPSAFNKPYNSDLSITGLQKPNESNHPSIEIVHSSTEASISNQNQLTSNGGLSSSNWLKPNEGSTAGNKAEGIDYSGGFGGPPGLLKPYDDGKLGTQYSGNVLIGTQSNIKYGTSNSNYDTSSVLSTTSVGSNFNAQGTPGAIAPIKNHDSSNSGFESTGSAIGLSTSSTGNGIINQANNSLYTKKINNITSEPIVTALASARATAGATSTAFSNNSSAEDRNLPKTPYFSGWNSGLNTASASAKSSAGALSGARAFSVGGGYASSSATAHASSGYFTKGGYGK